MNDHLNPSFQLTSSIPQTLRLSEDQLFDNVPPSTGSYHSTERIMKGVENVLKRKMDILAISLLQLSVLVLAVSLLPYFLVETTPRIAQVISALTVNPLMLEP